MTKAKVFGIGLNKTGTTTLGDCLKSLGYKHLSCDRELLEMYRNGEADRVLDYMDDFDSFEDWPYPLMYREIWDRYGDSARYILTTRISPEKWLRSLEAHALYTHPIRNMRTLAYGHRYPQTAPDQHLEFYNAHNAQVREFFAEPARQELFLDLCWEKGHGWPELCAFLDRPIPDSPLKKANVSAERDPSGYEIYNKILIQLTKAGQRLIGR